LHRPAVEPVEVGRCVAQPGAPVGARAPSGRLQLYGDTGPARDVDVPLVVLAQQGRALLVLDQGEGREVRQVGAVVVDQVGLETAVGDDRGTGHLGKLHAVLLEFVTD
jgi:hypothetical protein